MSPVQLVLVVSAERPARSQPAPDQSTAVTTTDYPNNSTLGEHHHLCINLQSTSPSRLYSGSSDPPLPLYDALRLVQATLDSINFTNSFPPLDPTLHPLPPQPSSQNSHSSHHVRLHLGSIRSPPLHQPPLRRLLPSLPRVPPTPDSTPHRRTLRLDRPRLAPRFKPRRLLPPPLQHPLVRPVPPPSILPPPSTFHRPHPRTRWNGVVEPWGRRSAKGRRGVLGRDERRRARGERVVGDQVQGSSEGTMGSGEAASRD